MGTGVQGLKHAAKLQESIYLFQTDDGHLEACTLEDGKNSPYIIFFALKGITYKKRYPCRLIDDPVIVIRDENGEIRLQNDNGDHII